MAFDKWPEKDPDEVLDYLINWAVRLGADTIDTSTWIMPTSPDALLVKDSDSNTTTTTTIWMSGGTLGKTYNITNRIVTDGGRTMDKTLTLKIVVK